MPIGLPTAATVKSRKSRWANGILGICSQTHCVSNGHKIKCSAVTKAHFGKKVDTSHLCQLGFQQLQQSNLENPVGPTEFLGICSQTHCVRISDRYKCSAVTKAILAKKLTPHTCADWACNSCNSQISKIPLGQRNSGDLLTDSLCEKSVTDASVQQSQKHMLWQKVDSSNLCQLGFQQLQQSNLENPIGPTEFWGFAHRLTV